MALERKLVTKQTIANLTNELKGSFATKTALAAVETKADAAFKTISVSGNTISFWKNAAGTGTADFTVDFPTEYFLDQANTKFESDFVWSLAKYPGTTDPSKDHKPVMVLAVKDDEASPTINYSFLDMSTLVDTYSAKVNGKHASTTVTISGYEVDVQVNISADTGNQLQLKSDGLFVPATDISGKADKDTDAVENNVAVFDTSGNPVDSGVPVANVVLSSDVEDYTQNELAALLGTAANQGD